MDWAIFLSVLLAIWVACTCYTIPLAYHSLKTYSEKRGQAMDISTIVLDFVFVIACGPFLIGVFHLEIRRGDVT